MFGVASSLLGLLFGLGFHPSRLRLGLLQEPILRLEDGKHRVVDRGVLGFLEALQFDFRIAQLGSGRICPELEVAESALEFPEVRPHFTLVEALPGIGKRLVVNFGRQPFRSSHLAVIDRNRVRLDGFTMNLQHQSGAF